LATFLGRKKYMEGSVEDLTSLYDCDDLWTSNTKTGGTITLRNIFMTFLGCTTPSALNDSIPFSAFGGGFMSRMIAICQEPTRSFPEPRQVLNGPQLPDLAERLAHIAMYGLGEYRLSDNARLYYHRWYPSFKKLIGDAGETKQNLLARYDNNLLKLAMLIRASQYGTGRTVTTKDFVTAKQIMEATYNENEEMITEVGVPVNIRNMRAAERRIKLTGERTRRQLLTGINWTGGARECTLALYQLYQEGKIEIYLANRKRTSPSTDGHEKYVWISSERSSRRSRDEKD
jgi:hypothetical protein